MIPAAIQDELALQSARTWLDEARTGLLVTQDDAICFANAALHEMMGAEPGSLRGRPLLSTVAPEDVDRVREQVRQRIQGAPGRPYDIRCRRDDGSLFDARVCGRRILFGGAPADLITLIDVTELKDALRRAHWDKHMLERVERLCRSGSFEIDLPGGDVVLSSGLRALANLPEDRPSPERIDQATWLPPEERALVAGFWRHASHGEPFEFQHQLLSADGRRLVVLHRGVISEVRPDGRQRGVAILQDITAQRDAEQRIQELATRDEVTGLLNRASFLQQVDTAVQGAQWDPYQFALLALDVPRIDEVKATLGFGAGDALTMTIAARLNLCCGEGETVAHLGGSEFALLLTPSHQYRPETTLQRAQDVLAALQAPHRIGSHEVFPLCVVGIANFPDDGRSAAQLLECAQTARLGTGSNSGIAFFQPQANAQAMRELRLEAALRNAVAQGELSLQYQPQVDLSTGVITGAEALLRWTNAEFGVVPAAELIAVAERSALIGPIGAWVLREACQQAMAWRRSGLPALRVSVNLSAAQLLLDGPQGGVADSIQAALREAGADADCLGIELPESTLLTNVQRTTALLRQIRSLGVQIAVDDFGTGMSSMSSLRSVPIDVVKVDRSFVHDVTTAPAEVSVTRAIITMAHSLHIRVLAMGVESESQAGLLVANGCDAIQGYWFSPPLPAAGFEALLREGRRLPERFTTRPQRKRTLLLVDDEENILSSLRRLFRRDGYHILTASSAAEGLQRLVEGSVDVILSDQRMPGMTGVEFLRRAKDLYPETVRMVLSGFTELQSIIDAVNEGAIYKFLTKPWDDGLLRSHVSEAFRTKEMADENRRLAREVEAAANDLATLNERLEQSLLQQRQQAELLQASSGGLREILDELPAAVVGIDTEGMVAYINREALMVLPEACDLLGRMASEALPQDLQLPTDEPQAGEHQVHIAGRHFQAFRRPLRKGRVPRGALWLLVPTSSGDSQ